jgi:hypothetical protein
MSLYQGVFIWGNTILAACRLIPMVSTSPTPVFRDYFGRC